MTRIWRVELGENFMVVRVEAPTAAFAEEGAIFYAKDGMKKKDLKYFEGEGASELEVTKVELESESQIKFDLHEKAVYARMARKRVVRETKQQ